MKRRSAFALSTSAASDTLRGENAGCASAFSGGRIWFVRAIFFNASLNAPARRRRLHPAALWIASLRAALPLQPPFEFIGPTFHRRRLILQRMA